MRLRKVTNNWQNNQQNDWQKCCRYCHHFKKGVCLNNNVSKVENDLAIYSIIENGHLEEALEESLGSVRLDEFKELETLLRSYKVSERRIKEFNDLFLKCWEEFIQNTLKWDLDGSIEKCFMNHLNDYRQSELTIKDPNTYCCKDWC